MASSLSSKKTGELVNEEQSQNVTYKIQREVNRNLSRRQVVNITANGQFVTNSLKDSTVIVTTKVTRAQNNYLYLTSACCSSPQGYSSNKN